MWHQIWTIKRQIWLYLTSRRQTWQYLIFKRQTNQIYLYHSQLSLDPSSFYHLFLYLKKKQYFDIPTLNLSKSPH